MNDSTASGDDSSGIQAAPPQKAIAKKKRNLPGMPDPDAEVIALSPKTLMATNRFVCEVCKKGFQRDQNLQLHRRGHNLPWKLRQRSSKDVKKRVYVCPEPSCVHHEPSRALGDLTGIKKHFCRKHGEKKWKCDKCSKKYAVQSDWKAHSKICGTKEYKCDCGTLFNRKDSFITHRAFCDALAEETSKPASVSPPSPSPSPSPSPPSPASSPPPPLPLPSEHEDSTQTDVVSLSLPDNNNHVTEMLESAKPDSTSCRVLEETPVMTNLTSGSSCNGSSSSNVFATLFASSTSSGSFQSQTASFSNLFRSIACPDPTPAIAPSSSSEPVALGLAVNQGSSIFGTAGQDHMQYPPAPLPSLSATALLQKAAQMGAAASNTSLLRGLGIASSSSSPSVSHDGPSLAGLGLACDSGSGLKELMLGTPSIFGPKHTTLDLLGLGMAATGGSTSGLSVLMNGGLDVGRDFGGQDIR
ncbi:zinc finger protein GAI-ASSOCIATED FACTOR 1-like isoform X1 [Salvia splendens]|uniref:zinc finger protein GAI-ASSOCIATED FACTOR 1-like isoform X1 n=1 Tax=Salvia splendens TaxID=180675 RepID=UPI001C257F2F|nr:zinc finger protein GAI-ASSOCIATED FACTOR 1-like isoform X1 [Salvia splendens]